MIRLIFFFLVVGLIAYGFAWLADQPGNLIVNWQERRIEMPIFWAFVGLGLLVAAMVFLWSALTGLIRSPAMITDAFKRRTQRRGLEALSTGIIAVGAGDRDLASRYAGQARKALPNEPLTELLRAQAAQLSGDKSTARRIYESMLAAPDTEALGLRGLFIEAQAEGEDEAARQFAERALRTNATLDWPIQALFDMQVKAGDYSDALETLHKGRRAGHVPKEVATRHRAVLLAAVAQAKEDDEMDAALDAASEAHKLAPDLVPAAEVAGRIHATKGNTSKAASIIEKTWRHAPHPDLATAYAFARPGDSPKDRLERVKKLVAGTHDDEGPIALAVAAIEAQDWDLARASLKPLLEDDRLTKKVCALMARIEGEQSGDRGRVREWLSRAVAARRDRVWVDEAGAVSDEWLPASPATGQIDAFRWDLPPENAGRDDTAVLAEFVRPLAIAESVDGTSAAGDGDAQNGLVIVGDDDRTPVDRDAEDLTILAETAPEKPTASATPTPAPTANGATKPGNGGASSAPRPAAKKKGKRRKGRRAHVPRS